MKIELTIIKSTITAICYKLWYNFLTFFIYFGVILAYLIEPLPVNLILNWWSITYKKKADYSDRYNWAIIMSFEHLSIPDVRWVSPTDLNTKTYTSHCLNNVAGHCFFCVGRKLNDFQQSAYPSNPLPDHAWGVNSTLYSLPSRSMTSFTTFCKNKLELLTNY